MKFTIINMGILFIGLSIYWLVWGWAVVSLDLSGLQSGTVSLIYAIQSSFGWPVSIESPALLHYTSPLPGFGVEIIALCLGIGEMLFFTFLVLFFRGPKWKAKLQGLAIFLPIIFAANLIRLLAIYPLAEWVGIAAMWGIHWHIWKWGMFAVIMAFFAEWYILFARDDIMRSFKQ